LYFVFNEYDEDPVDNLILDILLDIVHNKNEPCELRRYNNFVKPTICSASNYQSFKSSLLNNLKNMI